MNFNELRLDAILNTYIKVTKAVKVYQYPSDKTPVWWVYEPNKVVGKLYSWVDTNDPNNRSGFKNRGVYMMFYIDEKVGNKPYFIKLLPQTLDWRYLDAQLDTQRRAALGWSAKIWDDIETKLVDVSKDIDEAASKAVSGTLSYIFKTVLPYALPLGAVYVAFKWWQGEAQVRTYERLIKTAGNELAKR